MKNKYSIIHVGLKNGHVFAEFDTSASLNRNAPFEAYLRRQLPNAAYFARTLLRLEGLGDFAIYFPSDIIVKDGDDIKKRLLLFRAVEGCALGFLDEVWLIPVANTGRIKIKNEQRFLRGLEECIDGAFYDVTRGVPLSIVTNCCRVPNDEWPSAAAPLPEEFRALFMEMVPSVLSYTDVLIRLLMKLIVSAPLYYNVAADGMSQGTVERTADVDLLKKLFTRQDFLHVLERTVFATTALMLLYARIVIRYSGAMISGNDDYSKFSNPAIMRFAIQKGIDSGRDAMLGRLLLSRTCDISDLFRAYNFFMTLATAIDGVDGDLPSTKENPEMFIGDYDDDAKTKKGIEYISDIISELSEIDERTSAAFKLRAKDMTDIMLGFSEP